MKLAFGCDNCAQALKKELMAYAADLGHECVDCGACEPVCPVEAIYYEDDVPTEWSDYYRANVEFFDDLGSPGGAAKMGLIEKDDPMIAALPPQA